MIYQLSLQTTGIIAGILLLLGHLSALFQPTQAIALARALPRSRAVATFALAIAAVWSFILVRSIDLGEFSPLRNILLIAIVAAAILSWKYMDEFLAVRALGMILLLAAEPLLESAVLRDEGSRLFLVLLAYLWVVAGLFLVGMPYLLRDAITWVTAERIRWTAAVYAGIGYGVLLIVCAIFLW